jgi:hypothetical protein
MSQFFSICGSNKVDFLQRLTEITKAVQYVKYYECAVVFSSFDGVGRYTFCVTCFVLLLRINFAVDVLPLRDNKHFNGMKR